MAESYLSITELNQRIAALLERNVPLLWVQGEISNLTRAASGHWYFSLKDEKAQVRAVMFRPKVNLLNWQPREGDAVQAYVSAGLYAPRGDFQLNVETVRRAGIGNLYEQFLRLKEKLEQAIRDYPAVQTTVAEFNRRTKERLEQMFDRLVGCAPGDHSIRNRSDCIASKPAPTESQEPNHEPTRLAQAATSQA